MAQCAQITDSGLVQFLNVPLDQCKSLLLLDGTDYASLQTAANIWSMDPVQFAQAFGFGFGLVLTCFLVAYGWGVLINMFEKEF